jgi:serine/threonine protein kinase
LHLDPGAQFDRYTVQGLLGEGGMGTVYRAFDSRLLRPVALKLLRSDRHDSPEALDRGASSLLREARAAAALEHVNAVAIYDVGELGGTPYIAMELVEGRAMRAHVGDASVPLPVRLKWLAQVGDALAAAHGRGLVHRDIKPENVMIRTDGVAKVLDFGIASVSEGESPISRTGAILGTPRYMAPEQIDGSAVDGRTDQFGWAVTAYELLTGSVPWPNEVGTYSLALAIMHSEPRPLRERAPALSGAVERVVLRAMAKSPDDRFASMTALVDALRSCMDDRAPDTVRSDQNAFTVRSPSRPSTPPAARKTPSRPVRRPEVKSTGLVAFAEAARRIAGEPAWQRVLDALPHDTRPLFVTPPTGVVWLDARHYYALLDALVWRAFEGRPEPLREVARSMVEADLRGIYRVLVRVATPHFLASRAPTLYNAYWRDHGALRVEWLGPQEADIVFENVPVLRPLFVHAQVGAILAGFEVAGAKGVRANILKTSPTGARIRATWR